MTMIVTNTGQLHGDTLPEPDVNFETVIQTKGHFMLPKESLQYYSKNLLDYLTVIKNYKIYYGKNYLTICKK